MSIKNNTTDLRALLEVANNLPDAGDNSEQARALVNRTITEFSDDTIEEVGDYVFVHCSALTSVSLPACTTIGKSAFYGCSSLKEAFFPACTSVDTYAFGQCFSLSTASFPVCTFISSSAFQECRSLQNISFPVCSYISAYAFRYCYSLTSVSFPECEIIGGYTFYCCSNLTSISFPVCTTVSINAFQGCSNLTIASFPACTSINRNAFSGCINLTTISFPECITIADGAFTSCVNLTTVSFPTCTTISMSTFCSCSNLTTAYFGACTKISGSYTFRYCYRLSSLTLGASTVCTLSKSDAFASTPYAGYSTYFSGTPYIYVPSSLVASYKTATNWTYFSSYISAIGGGSGSGQLISFTIIDQEFQAEEGMTWDEWIKSSYSYGNFEGDGKNVRSVYMSHYCVYDSNSAQFVILTDTIQANVSYDMQMN